MQNPLVLRLELDNVRRQIGHMITDGNNELSEMMQAELDRQCTVENLASIIDAHVRQELQATIRRSVEAFFKFGDGKQAVDEVVKARLAAFTAKQ